MWDRTFVTGLLTESREALWRLETRYEGATLFQALCDHLPDLAQEIWPALAADMAIPDSVPQDERRMYRDRHIFEVLSFIEQRGGRLPPSASADLADIEERHPKWNRAEAADLLGEHLAERMLEARAPDVESLDTSRALGLLSDGGRDAWTMRELAQTLGHRAALDSSWGRSFLEAFVSRSPPFAEDVTNPVLWGLRSGLKSLHEKGSHDEALRIFTQVEKLAMGENGAKRARALPSLLREWVGLRPDSCEPLLPLVHRLLPVFGGLAEDEANTPRGWFQHALNHPVGHLTELLLQALDAERQRAGKVGERPSMPPGVQADISQLVAGSGPGALYGLSLLGRQLPWLEAVFPDWTSESLLPVMLWQLGEAKGVAAWSGFLWQAALSRALSRQVEGGYLRTFQHREQLAEEEREGLLRHWAGLVWYRAATLEQLQTVSDRLAYQERSQVLAFWRNHLERAEPDKAEAFWREVLLPFWKWSAKRGHLAGEAASGEALAYWELLPFAKSDVADATTLALNCSLGRIERSGQFLETALTSSHLQLAQGVFLKLLLTYLQAQAHPRWDEAEWLALW
jgi:hypothetical protein